MDDKAFYEKGSFWLIAGIITAGIIALLMIILPIYGVWVSEMNGRAELAQAEYSKKVAVETAKAKKESAVFEAEAEVTRAGGVAGANNIVKSSITDQYIRYLWVQTLDRENVQNQIIYVPTEMGLPITEAGRGVQVPSK